MILDHVLVQLSIDDADESLDLLANWSKGLGLTLVIEI